MEKLTLIGIGTGHPDHVTLAGLAAMREVDCVLLPRKAAKDDLAELRRALLRRHAPETAIIEFDMPIRDVSKGYHEGVEDWHDRIALAWSDALPEKVSNVGLLVWGDPSLYDSTLRIAARLTPPPETRVIPGITALQALTAAHAIPLNEVNAPVLITTGRQLRDNGWPEDVDRIAVMLDGQCSFQSLDPKGIHIWWGAFLAMDNQRLVSGPLIEKADEILKVREEARAEHGWIMDTYLLERSR